MKNAYSKIEMATRYDSTGSLPPHTKTLWLDALQFAITRQEIRADYDWVYGV